MPPGRCIVLEVGDSVGNDLGWGLARELKSTPGLTLVQKDKSSSGLTTPWFYDWTAHVVQFLHRYRPHLMVVAFGANDEQNMTVNGHVVAFGSAPWVSAYASQIRRVARAATRAHAYVLWIGMPVMGPNFYRQNMVFLNSLYARHAPSVPGVTFLPTWNLFAGSHGQFLASAVVNGVPTVIRTSDGVHFSYVGENVFATFVAQRIAAIYHVRLAPGAPMALTP